jgi:hypothetical protein
MPVEIRELVIKATVAAQAGGEGSAVSIKFQMPAEKEIQNWVAAYIKQSRKTTCSEAELVKAIREFVKVYPQ